MQYENGCTVKELIEVRRETVHWKDQCCALMLAAEERDDEDDLRPMQIPVTQVHGVFRALMVRMQTFTEPRQLARDAMDVIRMKRELAVARAEMQTLKDALEDAKILAGRIAALAGGEAE